MLELCAARYDEARRESADDSRSRFEPGVLTDLIEVNYGKDHKKLADGPYPVYGSGGLMRHVEKYLHNGESVLIPRKGTLNNVMLVDGRFWTVDTMFFTKELSIGAARYAYFILKRLDLTSMNAGSAVPSMTTKILSAIPVSIPDDDLLQELKEWSDPLFAQIRLNEQENEQLESMRDALLPKLMSGEIDVSEVELPTQPNNHLPEHRPSLQNCFHRTRRKGAPDGSDDQYGPSSDAAGSRLSAVKAIKNSARKHSVQPCRKQRAQQLESARSLPYRQGSRGVLSENNRVLRKYPQAHGQLNRATIYSNL